LENKLRIISNQYSILGKYLEIFVSGCNHNHGCSGTCFNRESWDFSLGTEWELLELKLTDKILTNIDIIDLLIVTGGEPLDQDLTELLAFIKFLKTFKIPICVFTSYKFKEVRESIKANVDYLKCNPFDVKQKKDKDVGLFVLASTNQVLYKKEPDGVWSCI